MLSYQTRILRADRSTDVIVESNHLNDNAAIRSARKLAEARPFEVWQDLRCIYGRTENAPAKLKPLSWKAP
jgi:hypothetical protein